jgi:LacI family transcriptional regulator
MASIALVNRYNTVDDSFWQPFIIGVEKTLRLHNYSLVICMFSDEDQKQLRIPETIYNNISGIIMTGVYTREYSEKFHQLDIPLVFVDTVAGMTVNEIKSDIIMMENRIGVYQITKRMIELGHCDIGFFGDIFSCASYNERWQGFTNAMNEAGLLIQRNYCILPDIIGRYSDVSMMDELLKKMSKMPTAFVCCNDTRAINLGISLRQMGYVIPNDISIAGFDDIREATIFSPQLTTVHCFREELGIRTAQELLWRFENPKSPYEIVTHPTEVIFRDSIMHK